MSPRRCNVNVWLGGYVALGEDAIENPIASVFNLALHAPDALSLHGHTCGRGGHRGSLSRSQSAPSMRSVVDSVERVFASGLNPEVLHSDTATEAAKMRSNFPAKRQPAVQHPDKLSVQPHHFAIHCLEPSAIQVAGPKLLVAILDSTIE